MKRLLSIDGGGLRGIFALAVLARMETLLKQKHGDHYQLHDHFDYIGGTSTGAIIGALLSWGYSAQEVITQYKSIGLEMFEANFVWKYLGNRIGAAALAGERFKSSKIEKKLKELFTEKDGSLALLNSSQLKTRLLIVTKNARTGSTWPITNNPKAKYNVDPDVNPWSNLNYPLWQVIRASTAAPSFFPPEELTIHSKEGTKKDSFTCTFQDGGITPYNNPAYLLYLKATLPEYNMNWDTGEDKLHLVSLGTGYVDIGTGNEKSESIPELLTSIPRSLIQSNQIHQDIMCRTTGRCLFGAPIDSELGDLVRGKSNNEQNQFTYVRYNHLFSSDPKKQDPELPFPYPDLIAQKLPMEKTDILEPLLDFGIKYANKNVQLSHL